MNEFEFLWSQNYSNIFFAFAKLILAGRLIMFIINCFIVAFLETTGMLLSICLLLCFSN